MERVAVCEHEFKRDIRCLEHRSYIERFYLFSAAPVLAGTKPAVLVSLRAGCRGAWDEMRAQLESATNLSSKPLYEKGGIFSLLVYDEAHLGALTASAESRRILAQYGYPPSGNLAELLDHLTLRFRECKFPHEIGVFLGYPHRDVQSFIDKGGKDFLCCRYWKVYHDEQRAREVFRSIDEARARAISLMARQVPLHQAAQMLAAANN